MELNGIEIMIKGAYFLIDLFEPLRNLIVPNYPNIL